MIAMYTSTTKINFTGLSINNALPWTDFTKLSQCTKLNHNSISQRTIRIIWWFGRSSRCNVLKIKEVMVSSKIYSDSLSARQ